MARSLESSGRHFQRQEQHLAQLESHYWVLLARAQLAAAAAVVEYFVRLG